MFRLSNRLVLISIVAALSLATTWIIYAGPADVPCNSAVTNNGTNEKTCQGSEYGAPYTNTAGDNPITNNGTVDANIFGIGTISTGTGTANVSTTIINNGTVKGDIVGSYAMGGGVNVSNTFVLKDNAIVDGTIDGGIGATNTIVFNMT